MYEHEQSILQNSNSHRVWPHAAGLLPSLAIRQSWNDAYLFKHRSIFHGQSRTYTLPVGNVQKQDSGLRA